MDSQLMHKKTRIFKCTGKNIKIKNITLKRGFAKDGGGAIYNKEGKLTVSDSTLQRNTSKRGGAICLTKDSKKYEQTIALSKTTTLMTFMKKKD